MTRFFYDESVNYEYNVFKSLSNNNYQSTGTYYEPKAGIERNYKDDSIYEQRYMLPEFSNIRKEKTNDKIRIAIAGDSFTKGKGVSSVEDRYTSKLNVYLN